MPIYEYDCHTCNDRFEKLVRSITPTNMECPTCGSKEVSKRFSVFGMKTESSSSAPSESTGGGCSGGGCGSCGCH